MCSKKKYKVCGLLVSFIDRPEPFLPDGTHLNHKGKEKLGSLINLSLYNLLTVGLPRLENPTSKNELTILNSEKS